MPSKYFTTNTHVQKAITSPVNSNVVDLLSIPEVPSNTCTTARSPSTSNTYTITQNSQKFIPVQNKRFQEQSGNVPFSYTQQECFREPSQGSSNRLTSKTKRSHKNNIRLPPESIKKQHFKNRSYLSTSLTSISESNIHDFSIFRFFHRLDDH